MGEKPRGDPKKLLSGLSYSEKWKHQIKCDVAYVFYHPLCTYNFQIKGKKVASFHSEAFLKKVVPLKYGIIPILASYGTRILEPLELRGFDAVHVHFPQDTIKHRRIYTIPHWVDTDTFRPGWCKDDTFTVLYVGRAVWQRGWEAFLRIAKVLKSLGIKCRYVGGYVAEKAVESLGYISNPVMLSMAYGTSHVLLNPSAVDGGGKAVMESLACGTPVIARRTTEIDYLKLPVIDSRQENEFIQSVLKIKEIWESSSEYVNVSRKCRSSVEKFSYEAVIGMFENMFKEVVSL